MTILTLTQIFDILKQSKIIKDFFIDEKEVKVTTLTEDVVKISYSTKLKPDYGQILDNIHDHVDYLH